MRHPMFALAAALLSSGALAHTMPAAPTDQRRIGEGTVPPGAGSNAASPPPAGTITSEAVGTTDPANTMAPRAAGAPPPLADPAPPDDKAPGRQGGRPPRPR